MVITANWETDLNSEKISGSKQNITTNVVFTIALPVVLIISLIVFEFLIALFLM